MSLRAWSLEELQHSVPGYPPIVPLVDGRNAPYINLDNAASTPPLGPVLGRLTDFMRWYSSVHRGSGFLSQTATVAYEDSRRAVGAFAGASSRDSVAFVKNTTEAINKLSYRLQLEPDDVVIITEMEHHSNDLPWRDKARIEWARTDARGALDLDDLHAKIRRHSRRLRLVAVTGASNVTGHINDVHTIARLAHNYGAPLLVDAAQLAPHRRMNMLPAGDPAHIDFLAFSGHKMYAPFGSGALIGPREVFGKGAPEFSGGGTVLAVTRDYVIWAPPPESEEPGSPNVPGAVAMGVAALLLTNAGMARVAAHELALLTRLLEGMRSIPGLTIYGDPYPGPSRLGVVAFNIKGASHEAVAQALALEGGIGVRNGCFCARPYVHRLLGLSDDEIEQASRKAVAGRGALPGMVRISLGLYNTEAEINAAVELLGRVAGNPTRYTRAYDRVFSAVSPAADPHRYFSIFQN